MSGKIITTLTCVAAIMAMSSQALATQLYKARVLNHKEWSTGNVKASFKDTFTKNQDMFKRSLEGPENTFATVYSNSTNTEGKTNTSVTVNGLHNIYVSNNTSIKQTYQYTFSICAETSQHTSQCSFYYDELELEAGGYASVDKEPILQVTYDKAGTYRAYTGTFLMLNDGNGKMFYNHSSSESKITIS